jgi:excinuclease ABC subunit C
VKAGGTGEILSVHENRLERTLAQLPDAPGVYMMIGEDGRILYIGKAVSLRHIRSALARWSSESSTCARSSCPTRSNH